MHKKLTREQFGEIAQERDSDGKVSISKAYAADIKQVGGAEDRTLRFTISTKAVDRDGDTIDPKGWDLSNFKRGGSVLWAHDNSQLPVARPTRTWVDGGKLKSHARFPTEDVYPFGDLVYRMIQDGMLRATSVGFLPKEWTLNEERKNAVGMPGVDFTKQELLEYSVVPVPSNPEALLEAKTKSAYDLSLLRDWCEKTLDGENTEAIWVPRKDIESTWDVLKNVQVKGDAGVIFDFSEIDDSETSASPVEEKTVITWAAAHPDGTPAEEPEDPWDGPAQIAAASIEDLLVMSAWREDKPVEDLIKSDFKLPHHDWRGEHAVNLRGVRAAMGALLGARGGVEIPEDERQGVYDHLARHLREDFDVEPPEFRSYSNEEFQKLFGDDCSGIGVLDSETVDDHATEDAVGDADAVAKHEASPSPVKDFEAAGLVLEKAESDVVSTLIGGLEAIAKQGRVLSSANEMRLREARNMLDQILGQLESEPEPEANQERSIELDLSELIDEMSAQSKSEKEMELPVESPEELSVLIGELVKDSLRDTIASLTGRVI